MMRPRFIFRKSDTGFWASIYAQFKFDRGVGAGVFGLIAGADADIPLRPWPQLWAERRPNGSALVAVTFCGFGLQIQTSCIGTPTC